CHGRGAGERHCRRPAHGHSRRTPSHAARTPGRRRRRVAPPCRAGGAAMNVSGEITVKAPREAVFDKLQDAPFFASCVDGVRDLQAVNDTHYTAVMETRVAYMKFTFRVSVEVVSVAAPELIE